MPDSRIQLFALPDHQEKPAELTARAKSLIPSARVCAEVNGHRLARWERASSRKDARHYSARCQHCPAYAYVHAAHGVNEYGGAAVMDACPIDRRGW